MFRVEMLNKPPGRYEGEGKGEVAATEGEGALRERSLDTHATGAAVAETLQTSPVGATNPTTGFLRLSAAVAIIVW